MAKQRNRAGFETMTLGDEGLLWAYGKTEWCITAGTWKEATHIEELEMTLVQPEDLKPVQMKNTEARKSWQL